MNWLNKIKTGVGRYMLNQKFKSIRRSPLVCNIADAKRIGILYNATELTSFEIIRDFVKKISSYNASVTTLGYVHSKNLIDHYLYRKGFDFFYKGNLNWYSMPKSEITDKFLHEPFDILINLSLEDYYPIQYITALSPATFKAGRFTSEDQYLDLMIDIEKETKIMKKLQADVKADTRNGVDKRILDLEMEKRSETELQLNFLINQLLHYLSIIKIN